MSQGSAPVARVTCPECGHEIAWHTGEGWVCHRCGHVIAPPPDEEEFETVGELWDDEQRRIRSMTRGTSGGRASGRRRKYRRVYAPSQPLDDDKETVRLRAAQLKKLPLRIRRRYVRALQRRYAEAKTKREKTLVLNEMEALGYARKWAIYRLRHPFGRGSGIDTTGLEHVLTALSQVLTPSRSA